MQYKQNVFFFKSFDNKLNDVVVVVVCDANNIINISCSISCSFSLINYTTYYARCVFALQFFILIRLQIC